MLGLLLCGPGIDGLKTARARAAFYLLSSSPALCVNLKQEVERREKAAPVGADPSFRSFTGQQQFYLLFAKREQQRGNARTRISSTDELIDRNEE